MRLRDIVKSVPGTLQTIRPDRPVQEAILNLVECNIGALPVVDAGGELVGIISERDVLRLCARDDAQSAMKLPVSEVMTRDLVVSVPEDRVDYLMRVMTAHRTRHLPVLQDGKLIDIVSIGDLVKSKADEQETELRFLRDYVAQAG